LLSVARFDSLDFAIGSPEADEQYRA
jgi:hypothetical protein